MGCLSRHDIFENKIKEILDDLAPLKKIQLITKNKCWLAQDTKEAIEKRDKLKREAAENGDMDKWKEYKISRNKCTSLVRRDKRDKFTNIYKNIDDKSDIKELYNVTKKINLVGRQEALLTPSSLLENLSIPPRKWHPAN